MRVDLLHQVFHEEMKETGVGIRVKHSDSLAEFVFQKRVKGIPVNENMKEG